MLPAPSNHPWPRCGLDELACSQTAPGHSSGVRMGQRPLPDLPAEVSAYFDPGAGERHGTPLVY